MVTVRNLTPSPYDLQSTKGMVRLPAFGEVTADFRDDYLQILEASLAVKVLGAPHPLDHDGDGKKGGSLPADAADAEIQRLRAEYTDLTGKKPHHRWGAPRLQSEIDAALEA